MKIAKCFFFIFCFICFSAKGQSNIDFGLKGGLNLTFFKVTESSFGFNQDTEIGYYGGAFLDFEIDESYSIQPELLFIALNDFKFLNAPIYVKYEIAKGLNILVGPSINYFFDFFSNKLKIRGDLSASYNFTGDLDFHMKYALGFEELTPNSLFVGVGLRL
ncbi:PorT family protein [Seonamhaeicola maritimus]|uniref:PorT family protein n=1 Tax=Seonamhaeicola maritimus TaxID=2591822 RepID=A0A5C7GM87_9FLAO|nr:PorT family protein [Seonamhaeicola maritimus]TXG39442.1 PorT family protein [Seonamhaeicola maritimus]